MPMSRFPSALLHRAVSGTHVCWKSQLIADPFLQKAYMDAAAIMTALWDNRNSLPSLSLKPLLPYYKVQNRNVKAQLQLPLSVFQGTSMEHLELLGAKQPCSDPATDTSAELVSSLPSSVLSVGFVFYTIALQYLTTVVREFFPSADEAHGILKDLGRQSVYRIWWYGCSGSLCGADQMCVQKGEDSISVVEKKPQGEDLLCRAHHDPGLCTVMPLGSQPGLEIAALADPTLEADPRFQKEQTSSPTKSPFSNLEWNAPSPDPNLSEGEDSGVPLLLMNNTSLQGLSGGAIRHCYHRVARLHPGGGGRCGMQDAPPSSPFPRINLVLELRPSRNDWYDYKPSTMELEKFTAFQKQRLSLSRILLHEND